MTTAGRPTFDPGRGGRGKWEGDLSAMSKQYSARDMPSHTKLKTRQDGQNSASDIRGRDFRRELEDRESRSIQDRSSTGGSRSSTAALTSGHEKRDRGSRGAPEYSSSSSKKNRLDPASSNVDADDPLEEDYEDGSGAENGESDDEEETAELMAELSRIKRERATEATKQAAEKKVEDERIRTENILKGNPLMNQPSTTTDFKVKRRWDDDVVFKNCARGEVDKSKRGYINDTLRSEFHKKFMDRYIH